MPTILIKINAPESLKTDEQEIKILIKDALHDFLRIRQPNIQYVETRYPNFNTGQKRAKRQQLTNRCGIAYSLLNSSISVFI